MKAVKGVSKMYKPMDAHEWEAYVEAQEQAWQLRLKARRAKAMEASQDDIDSDEGAWYNKQRI